jgi:hypothetical protein
MVTSILLLASTSFAQNGALLDANFASSLCEAWNASSLTTDLGRSGSEWIDSAGSTGTQTMVVGRRDCNNFQKVQLVITADENGNAICQSGGNYGGGEFQWKFEPTTEQWADFTDGFGVMKMPGIMSGFVGPYPTAAANIGNFEVFFALAGRIALRQNVNWECAGADMDDVRDEVEDIDQGDMNEILN